MIPKIFNLERRLQFKKRASRHFTKYDFLHKEIFLNHIERLSMMLQDMPKITFIDVPAYFMDFPEVLSFLKTKKTVEIKTITRDSEIFPIDIQEQNAIVALLTCHTLNDLVGYFIQIKNALQDDGVFIASFIGEHIAVLLKNTFMNVELDMMGACDNRFYPVIDIKTLGGLLQRAGFSLPVADSETYKVRYHDVKRLINDIRGMGESHCLHILPKALNRKTYNMVLNNLETAVSNHVFNIDIVTITGRSPSEVQQKSLKRGSAQISLSKILSQESEK
jgi:hypothetical protein